MSRKKTKRIIGKCTKKVYNKKEFCTKQKKEIARYEKKLY